jgi:hypothetical protein
MERSRGMAYACGHNHIIAAAVDGESVDLEGYFCPICMGRIVGHADMIDRRILAPMQVTQPITEPGNEKE